MKFSARTCRVAAALALFFSPLLAHARGSSRAQERQPLGSLSTIGNVSINGSPAPAELTIFSGDDLVTGPTGTATFTVSGKGSFKISPQTHIVFAGDPRYLAELDSGTVVMDSFAGSTDVTLKAGNFVVAPVIQTETSSARVDKTATGSFAVACLDGTMGVIPLEGANGRVLSVGQSLEITPEGALGATQEASSQPATVTPVKKPAGGSHTGWIILGVAGAGAAGAAAALAGHGHSQPVSPSS
ncbi:MAG TPA: hypothetical protein VLY23_05525 [Candidatus Acidoferrum sp.]|nr:hypothetical protein [Candidatus Acidoferrum sp.]